MLSIALLAEEIIRIDAALKDANPNDEPSIALRGAVEALRWVMYPDVTQSPTVRASAVRKATP